MSCRLRGATFRKGAVSCAAKLMLSSAGRAIAGGSLHFRRRFRTSPSCPRRRKGRVTKAARLPHENYAGGDVPRLYAALPVAVATAGGDHGEVDGGRAEAANVADLRHGGGELRLEARVMGDARERGDAAGDRSSLASRTVSPRPACGGYCGRRPGPFRRRTCRRSRDYRPGRPRSVLRAQAPATRRKSEFHAENSRCRRGGRCARYGFCRSLRPPPPSSIRKP